MTPDQARTELQPIRARLDEFEPGSAEHTDLGLRRSDIRQATQEAADAAHNPEAIQTDLDHLEHRLAAFEGNKINVPARQAAMTARDRSAQCAAKTNEAVARASAPDRDAIEERIVRLKNPLGR